MGVKERRERQRESLRQEILDAARVLFVKEGYENVSMRRVAERIEYSPTTIYLHFKDKADLLDSLCAETFSKLVERLERILEHPGDPIERLKRGLRAYVDFGLENPHHYEVTFLMPHTHHDPERYFNAETAGFKCFSFLRRGVQDCITAGKFRRADVETVSQALWTAVHGLTSLMIVHKRFPWVERERLVNLVLDSMVTGLAG